MMQHEEKVKKKTVVKNKKEIQKSTNVKRVSQHRFRQNKTKKKIKRTNSGKNLLKFSNFVETYSEDRAVDEGILRNTEIFEKYIHACQ